MKSYTHPNGLSYPRITTKAEAIERAIRYGFTEEDLGTCQYQVRGGKRRKICGKEVGLKSFYCKSHSLKVRHESHLFGNRVKAGYNHETGRRIVRWSSQAKKRANKSRIIALEKKRFEKGEVLPNTTPTFYDNYKEPLRRVEKGYGFYGVVAMDETKNFVQCHECGNLYKALGGHTKVHNLSIVEYKEKYGLKTMTALVGEEVREQRIKNQEMRKESGKYRGQPEHLKKYYDELERTTGKRSAPTNKGVNRWKLEKQNEVGMCPDQIMEKLTDLIKHLGRVPSWEEFRVHYNNRYHSSIQVHFGNWTNFVAAAGFETVQQAREHATSPEQLIKYLKEFYKEHGRVPMNSDFKRGIVVSRYHYFKHFGTLNNARLEADLPAVIPMPNRRYILIGPDDYIEWMKIKDQSKRARYRLYQANGGGFTTWVSKVIGSNKTKEIR